MRESGKRNPKQRGVCVLGQIALIYILRNSVRDSASVSVGYFFTSREAIACDADAGLLSSSMSLEE